MTLPANNIDYVFSLKNWTDEDKKEIIQYHDSLKNIDKDIRDEYFDFVREFQRLHYYETESYNSMMSRWNSSIQNKFLALDNSSEIMGKYLEFEHNLITLDNYTSYEYDIDDNDESSCDDSDDDNSDSEYDSSAEQDYYQGMIMDAQDEFEKLEQHSKEEEPNEEYDEIIKNVDDDDFEKIDNEKYEEVMEYIEDKIRECRYSVLKLNDRLHHAQILVEFYENLYCRHKNADIDWTRVKKYKNYDDYLDELEDINDYTDIDELPDVETYIRRMERYRDFIIDINKEISDLWDTYKIKERACHKYFKNLLQLDLGETNVEMRNPASEEK
jgi:hypothetical protein